MFKNDFPAALAFFFGLGVCPVLMGSLFFWLAGQSSTLTCRRLETTHIDCKIERAFLSLIPTDEQTLTKLTGTELTTSCEDGSCTYIVDLVTEDEVVSLANLATSDLDGVEAEKERIDNFINNTEIKSLEFTSSPAWIGMLLSLPFILVGGVISVAGLWAFFTKDKGK